MANYNDQHFLKEFLDLSQHDLKIGVVTALWNTKVTSQLKNGAIDILLKAGIPAENIKEWDVPGSYELIYASNHLALKGYNAIVCLGVIIQGETRHFDFIADAVANGIANVTLKHDIPIGFGVLTTDNMEQALERAGGKHGNKGQEAAWTVLKLLANS